MPDSVWDDNAVWLALGNEDSLAALTWLIAETKRRAAEPGALSPSEVQLAEIGSAMGITERGELEAVMGRLRRADLVRSDHNSRGAKYHLLRSASGPAHAEALVTTLTEAFDGAATPSETEAVARLCRVLGGA